MSVFHNIFILVSRFYIRYYPKYKYWATHAEMFLTLLISINLVSLLFLFSIRLNSAFLIIGVFILHFLIGFLFDKFDDKDYVLNYKLRRQEKIISYFIIVASFTFFISTLLFLNMKIA